MDRIRSLLVALRLEGCKITKYSQGRMRIQTVENVRYIQIYDGQYHVSVNDIEKKFSEDEMFDLLIMCLDEGGVEC